MRWPHAVFAMTTALMLVILAAVPEPRSSPTVRADERATAVAPLALTPLQRLQQLTLEQRIGQILMMGAAATGANTSTMTGLRKYHVGNVMLTGRSWRGTAATKAVVRQMTATVSPATTGGIRMFVSTDQEGGLVQVLNGPGYSSIPTAIRQGTLSSSSLRAKARWWGEQLKVSGVNVNLAPVADTVPSAAFAPYNEPIGYYGRHYGYTPQAVGADVAAYTLGMKDASIASVPKHFPGLGRVRGNTDTQSGVTDYRTTRTDPNRRPFVDGFRAGARWVMVSSAYYRRIDSGRPATFSPMVMRTMLRGDLGFSGIIVSDDVCLSRQLSRWSLGARAVNFFNAGGTMLLCVNPRAIPAIYTQVLSLARENRFFRAKVNAAALKVLQVKAEQ